MSHNDINFNFINDYYGSHAKIMCYMFTVAFIVYVGFNLVLYKLYEYLKHIKAIETRPLFDALLSVGNTIRRCSLFISMCTRDPVEKGIIRFSVIFIYQLYKGELNKRVLFFSTCFIVFNCFMQDYYSTFISFMSLDILVCYFDTNPPPPLNLRERVGTGSAILAHLATERVKDLSYDRKIEIMQQIRRKLIHNGSPDRDKLPLLNYGQLGVLKKLCSEPTLRNRSP